jgi:hypothetical protein
MNELNNKSKSELFEIFDKFFLGITIIGLVLLTITYFGIPSLNFLVPYSGFSAQKNKKFERKLCVQFTTNQMRLSRFRSYTS